MSLKKRIGGRDFHGLFKVPLYLVVPILGAKLYFFVVFLEQQR